VDEANFDAAYASLLRALDEAVILLNRFNESLWSGRLADDRAKIANGDRYALDHVLQAFGGMGSFNDLVIHRINGHDIDDREVRAVNDRLSALRTAIWSGAKTLRRDLDSSS
jgi:hypothetical protein